MPGFKSQLCHLLACDLGQLISLSESQFLLQSSGPGLINLGKAPAFESIATGDQLPPAGQQSPQLPWDGESWEKECDGCSPVSHSRGGNRRASPGKEHTATLRRAAVQE